jgi:hypothetical protein
MGGSVRHARAGMPLLILLLFLLTGCADMTLRNACVAATTSLVPENAADPAVLAAPSNLSGAYISGTMVRITWTDNSSTEIGFGVQRSAQGAEYVLVAFVGPGVTTCDNSYIGAGLPLYRVYAIDAAGKFAMSAPLNSIAPLPKTTARSALTTP